MSVLPGALRLIYRARLTPWRVEQILEETAGLRETLGRLRAEMDTSSQVLGDTLALLTRSVDDLAGRIASLEDRLGASES